jgi:NhaA family Na+:H+ antiporter
MTPVTPYLSRYAIALAAGAFVATVTLAVAPEMYNDLIDRRLLDLPGNAGVLTPRRIVDDVLMPAFLLLLGKEALEALTRERGALSGWRAALPLSGAAGGMLGAALVWLATAALLETAEEAAGAPGWAAPLGTDVVIAVALGRLVFGGGHPALQVLLLVTVTDNLAGLAIAGLMAPDAAIRPGWLLVPLAAALCGWAFLTRPAQRPQAREQDRQRSRRLAPWTGLAVLSWAGVVMAGLPPALGALPVLPAMPPAARSFGLFAQAEDFLTDPMNRIAQHLHRPLVAVMAVFGFVHGGIEPGAAGPATAAAVLAATVGKPAGVAFGILAAARLLAVPLPAGVTARDLGAVALLCTAAFTLPALSVGHVLPGGLVAEAARLGFALSVPVALALALTLRHMRRA